MPVVKLVLQVFYQLATQHLSSVSDWNEDPPIIQIGGGRFTTCSQADFLTRCVVYDASKAVIKVSWEVAQNFTLGGFVSRAAKGGLYVRSVRLNVQIETL